MYEDLEPGQQNEAENARKEVRWNIPVPIVVRGTYADGTKFEEEGTTEDASPSGMAIFLPAPIKKGSRLEITAQQEGFTSPAIVTDARAMGPSLHRVRVRFDGPKKYDRGAAARKFIYDTSSSSWAGYIEGGVYFNRKHEAHGKLEGHKVVSLDNGKDMFVKKGDSFYDLRGNFLGRLI
ncbi:MAG: PilZ domain-containing protein [Acidobacteria bacterium]|nr:PilZ domain-containing protein [Acidobacteriota bacterium]